MIGASQYFFRSLRKIQMSFKKSILSLTYSSFSKIFCAIILFNFFEAWMSFLFIILSETGIPFINRETFITLILSAFKKLTISFTYI